jgi:Tfp pilus assembly protein PilF
MRLASLNKFAVRPFSAIEKFGENGKDSIEFGRQLRADSILEGTIQETNGLVRVSLRVIDVRDGGQIWADSFDEAGGDILKLQDAISNRVARALITKLRPLDEELLAKQSTNDPEAYRLYLAGRERWLQRNGKTESLAFYKKAIEIDPNFALSYLGIADEYAFTYETQIAEDALAKAIQLDPNLAEAHATRGFIRMFHHWDWPGAEASLQRAIELAPNSSKAHHWYGVYLSVRGRFDEAQREMEKALELDPTALVIMSDIAELHYFRHDYEQAEGELMKAVAADPGFTNARQHLVKIRFKKGGSYFLEEADFNIFLQKKRRDDGLAQDYDPAELEQIVARGDERTLRDNTRKALEKANRNKPENYLALSRFYSIVGEKQRSLDALEKALEAKVFVIPFVAVDPLWDPVRGQARFHEILRKMNLLD